MFNKLKKKTEGFTIIEVLIVLAIAGLILLIVFLAVPALQRNSRNTQRRNDVQKMLGVLQEATNNNNGQAPVGAAAPGVMTAERYGQYTATSINYNVTAAMPGAAVPGTVDLNTVIVRNGYKCTGTTTTGPGSATTSGVTTSTGATPRTYISIFAVELQNGQVQSQCVES